MWYPAPQKVVHKPAFPLQIWRVVEPLQEQASRGLEAKFGVISFLAGTTAGGAWQAKTPGHPTCYRGDCQQGS